MEAELEDGYWVVSESAAEGYWDLMPEDIRFQISIKECSLGGKDEFNIDKPCPYCIRRSQKDWNQLDGDAKHFIRRALAKK